MTHSDTKKNVSFLISGVWLTKNNKSHAQVPLQPVKKKSIKINNIQSNRFGKLRLEINQKKSYINFE